MNYLELNRSAWDAKTAVHWNSDFYDVQGFIQQPNSLKEIELALLPDLQGQRLVHLQCHFGQDSLSLAKMGAEVTGLDFSPAALLKARELSELTGIEAEFVCGDVYQAAALLQQRYDLVFSSYGTIGWLPEVRTWAKNIAELLRPGGRFIFVEFHPVLWMLDDDFQGFGYDYFNTKPIEEQSQGSYADRQAPLHTQTVSWNHSLADVLGSLLEQGLRIVHFAEYPFSPYACFPKLKAIGPSRYVFADHAHQMPMTYSLVVEKPLL